jgi:hypothetical protein
MRTGAVEGVNPALMDSHHGSAPARTFVRTERIPSMPVQD